MDSDTKDGWMIALGIAFVICAIGWYSAAASQGGTTQSSSGGKGDTAYRLEQAEGRLLEYDEALNEANNKIEESASCVDDAFSLLDEGDFDDGLSQLDDCRYDTVGNPGSEI
jgi:hypothetical protein